MSGLRESIRDNNVCAKGHHHWKGREASSFEKGPSGSALEERPLKRSFVPVSGGRTGEFVVFLYLSLDSSFPFHI